MNKPSVHLGYEIESGAAVALPLRHMVVTGQTQEAGKTTTLEALVARAGVRAVAFVTKRGEGSFSGAKIIAPYFREQADWQFVAAILEASRGEKLKFERAWIIRAAKGARTLADVHRNVRKALESAKGLSADVYLTLDAYLEAVVPQIDTVRWAATVELSTGLNVMDLTQLNVEMQHLVIRSTVDWVLQHETDTVVVVPEAWKFIPQGRGTPVKLAAESFIRQAAGLRNYLWLDSQDIAGVDKLILKSVSVWLLGVQRESNEIKRTLAQIPAGIKKPKPEAIATLGLGEFFACYGTTVTKTYVQPAWMDAADAERVARGGHRPSAPIHPPKTEEAVNETEARELREENARLRRRLEELEAVSSNDKMTVSAPPSGRRDNGNAGSTPAAATDNEAIYQMVKERLSAEAPTLLRVLLTKQELAVEVKRVTVTIDGSSLKGRIARLVAAGFFDQAKRHGEVRKELDRTGAQVHGGNLSRELANFRNDGFLYDLGESGYSVADGAKVNVLKP